MSDHLNSILVKSDWWFNQEQPPEMFHKKAYFKTFAIFTGKHLCWSFFSLLFCEYCEIFKTPFLKIVYKKTDERYIEWKRMVQQLTKNDTEWCSEWKRMVQQLTTNDTEWYSKWRRVVQQVTTRDNEWRLAVISANFPFFRIREELNHSLYREHFIPWGEPIESRAETNP